MMKMPPSGMPPQGQPMSGGRGPSPVEKNLSVFNPTDAALMGASGKMSPDMSVRDFLSQQGIDVDGPVTQLVELAKKQVGNANPMTKMRNISADASLKPGGQPPTMPGVKPMVAPPGQPAPAGMEGLLSKLGGR
uniref:Uncharacterized protein n=1 Tax=viral metagenome TaxID=1070528 RepID=A0A6M3LN38_9ZZZZ